jgi:hypothetical protein
MPETDLVSYAQACQSLGVSRETLIWLVQREGLDVFRVPTPGGQRRRYLRRSDIERLGQGWRRRTPRSHNDSVEEGP